uniref:Zona pellucida sperm-binding protein 4-like n=1 Tax=Cynoglossus semilaevis TaxID=244447 RepID=A0A3P8WA77_CYNSE
HTEAGHHEEEDEPIPEDALPEMEVSAPARLQSFIPNHEYGVEGGGSDSQSWLSVKDIDRGYEVDFVDGPRSWSTTNGWESTGLDDDDIDYEDFSASPRSIDNTEKCNSTDSKAQSDCDMCRDTGLPCALFVPDCAVPSDERVPCGSSGMSAEDCEKMGCCVDVLQSTCYYPMDECTGDYHFVFSIRYDSAKIPVDPSKLVIPGHPECKPVIVNDKVAIFKFQVTECGARVYELGDTKIYLAEVQTIVQALNLKYGIITRTDPLRFLIECRYSKDGSALKGLSSVGFMVKTPSSILPSSVVNNGLFAVQLRIAKDKMFSSYLPTYHQPLRMLLGRPVYLELRIKSPVPKATLRVNYCLAYPRTAKNALVMVYEGCANPLDPSVSILKVSDLPTNRHQRRFIVTAFQFMDQKTNKYLDEEIYFMCSSEVCMPPEKSCEARCFDGKVW